MLYFSKLKIVIIYLTIIILSIFSSLNFFKNENNFFLSKNVNLGLDLQGGSYLLLEIDSAPVVNRNLQQKLLDFRKYLKEDKIKYKNLEIKNETINLLINNLDIEKFEEFFLNKDNQINTFYNQYRAYELDYVIENESFSDEEINIADTKLDGIVNVIDIIIFITLILGEYLTGSPN